MLMSLRLIENYLILKVDKNRFLVKNWIVPFISVHMFVYRSISWAKIN